MREILIALAIMAFAYGCAIVLPAVLAPPAAWEAGR